VPAVAPTGSFTGSTKPATWYTSLISTTAWRSTIARTSDDHDLHAAESADVDAGHAFSCSLAAHMRASTCVQPLHSLKVSAGAM
jgi:hypothetical protein